MVKDKVAGVSVKILHAGNEIITNYIFVSFE